MLLENQILMMRRLYQIAISLGIMWITRKVFE